jgi:hypothetical protein
MSLPKEKHTFHIPVMGLSYTIDSPIKIAHFGISSVISIIEHNMIEKMRKFYAEKFSYPYEPITTKSEDFRAKRITAYLDLVNDIVQENFNKLVASVTSGYQEIEKYFALLPTSSELRKNFNKFVEKNSVSLKDIQNWLYNNLSIGSIDVNIMTKLDSPNYKGKTQLPIEQNNAHASLRGFALSKLMNSSVVLSAGMNPRLFSYMEQFDDFYPDEEGNFKKKITIKVSDYRSAIIQGKFFAKKGLWVSEYRIESGLNCGGHAFASDGYLLGPILEEFKNNRETLHEELWEIYRKGLEKKEKIVPREIPQLNVTAQGGVGTGEEHKFLLNNFHIDSVGWGTPFLLVPEATSVDEETMQLLSDATEDDLYLSDASPLGVPFNNVRGSSKDVERIELAKAGKPGSSCPKKFLTFNTEFTELPICTASSQYINLKLDQLKKENLQEDEYKKAYDKVIAKECLCNGLSSSVLVMNNLDYKMEGEAVSVCPGPNMAYYSGKFSLQQMADHIYDRVNLLNRADRPNMFMKELKMYIEFLKDKIDEAAPNFSDKQIKYFDTFRENLNSGIEYYKNMFNEHRDVLKSSYEQALNDLNELEMKFHQVMISV